MKEEEIAKRFCKFELCTHRNGEGMCCLYNQDNCIFHRLEKENAELQSKVDALQGFLDHDIEYDMDKAIQNLKKENSELRNNSFTVSAMTEQQLRVAIEKGEQLEKENADQKDQLTKAKEIICEYVRLANLEKEDTVAIWQLYHKAEQFLKEIEK